MSASGDLTIPLVKEELSVDKRQVETGRVRIETATELLNETIRTELELSEVEIRCIPVGLEVDHIPDVRVEWTGAARRLPQPLHRLVLQHARSLQLRHGLYAMNHAPSDLPATLLFCVMAYAMLEEDVQATEFVGRLRQLAPGYSAGTFINTYPAINPPAVAATKQGAVRAEFVAVS